jgi:hypothetical protein
MVPVVIPSSLDERLPEEGLFSRSSEEGLFCRSGLRLPQMPEEGLFRLRLPEGGLFSRSSEEGLFSRSGLRLPQMPEEGLFSRSSKVISNKIQVRGHPIIEVQRVARLTRKHTPACS